MSDSPHLKILWFVLAAGFVLIAAAHVATATRPASIYAADFNAASKRNTWQILSATTLTTDTITIPTYPYAAHLYTATNTIYNIPYRWLHWAEYQGSNPHPVDQTYTRLILENDWLRVSLLPELGGRIYELIDKTTGNDELYRNPVIKPTHWGPPEQGWWLAAGGIEWGLPVEEHGYESALTWSYEVITGADGITVTVHDSLQPDRLRASVSIFLPNDRAVLIIHPRLDNDRNVDLNFKWWDNAMLAPGPGNSVGKDANNPNGTDLKFIIPESQVTVHSTGDSSLPGEGQPMAWPIYNGRDLSRLQNWNQWLGFFARPQASQDFAGAIDLAHQEGVLRIFPRTLAQGSKGFSMGWRNPIGAGQWTDDDSYYAELHGGLAPTFWDSVSIGAHQAIEWEEAWYPVTGLTDVTTANQEAALHLDQTGSQLNVTIYATRPHAQARLLVMRRDTCDMLLDERLINVTPASSITRTLLTSLPPDAVSVVLLDNDVTWLAYNVVDDGQPPAINIATISPYITQTTIPITLTVFNGDCARSWDVQTKEGLYGMWTNWLTDTTQMTHTYAGEHGHTYFFRARARDLAGQQSAYHGGLFGDTFTTVLLTPAPVLELSHKLAPQFMSPGQPIEYTLNLSNTGSLSATVTLTDTLPLSATLLTETLDSSRSPSPVFSNGQILWGGIVPMGSGVTISYALSPMLDLPLGAILTNALEIEGGVMPITRTAVVVNPYHVFLPLVLRNVPASR